MTMSRNMTKKFTVTTSTLFNFENNKNIYQVKGVEICIFIIFFYLLIATFSSYSDIQIKILIDFKYISPYTIIIVIGIIGFFITFIASLFFNFLGNDCNKEKKYDIKCYAAVSSYFDELKDKFNKSKNEFTLEIFITLLFIIDEFLYVIMYVFIIKYLNPTYLMLNDNIYFVINNIINYIDYYNSKQKHYTIKFLFNEFSELLVFLAFCIYLEVVELRFCGLNKNIRKNITSRGDNDSLFINESLINNNEEERNSSLIEMV